MTISQRIAVASSGLGHVARGIEAWADDLATALHSRGEDVRLYQGAGSASRSYEHVVPCWTRASISARNVLRMIPRGIAWRMGVGNTYEVEQTTFAANLIRILRREQVDILHVQDPQVALIAQRARQLRIIKTRTILAHGTEETPAFLKKIQYLQHLAPWHLDQVKAVGVWKPTWTAIPNFIDTNRFHPGRADELRRELNIPPDAVVVLTAAAIKRNHKRIDYLISEFAMIRQENPNIPLWLVIAGGKESETDELVTDGTNRLGDRVRFLVRFPRLRMPELYRAADLFVLCSLFEMMPIALIEAAASGLPCLVNHHPILEWMTGPGGCRIDMSQPSILKSAILENFTHREMRHTMGNAARAHCLANFSQETVVNQVLQYYQAVAADKRS